MLTWVSYAAKQARLKQAKEEAEKEIAEFRAFMEAEFQRKLEQVNKKQIVFGEETNFSCVSNLRLHKKGKSIEPVLYNT